MELLTAAVAATDGGGVEPPATNPASGHLDRPGYRLHRLKGDRRGLWSVSGNWRIVFRFVAGEAVDVDLIDYH